MLGFIKKVLADHAPRRVEEGDAVTRIPVLDIPSDLEVASYWLNRANVADVTPDDAAFIVEAFHSASPPREVWKSDRFRTIMARAGWPNAKDAWFHLVKPCNHALATARSLRRSFKAGLVIFDFLPSRMAIGPCPRAAALEGARMLANDVELAPFDDCPHPDQCACMYRSCLLFLGEDD